MNDDQFTDEMYDEDEFSDGLSNNNGGTGDNPPTTDGGDPGSSSDSDLTEELLRRKGISNPKQIKFADETGAVVERDWATLSRAEQLNILSDQDAEDQQLDDDEIALINDIRNSGMTVSDYRDSLYQSAEPSEPSYKIDELTDDEVYALDLLDKVGSDNITDAEIEEALTNAKKNPDLFKKTVDGVRAEYVRLQMYEEAKVASEAAAKKQANYNRFADSIEREIQNFKSFVGQPLEMSNDDQEELAAFMLDLDDRGTSAFGRALTNPTLFTKAAFWVLNEDKITEELTK